MDLNNSGDAHEVLSAEALGSVCRELPGEGMKTIIRRLRRIEDQSLPSFGNGILAALVRERIEPGRRRLAESDLQHGRARDAGERKREDVSGLSVEQIHHRGRARLPTE